MELARAVGTSPRFGAARGFTSGLELVTMGQRDGRVIIESQVIPPLQETTLIREAGMDQNGSQPWPIFWFRQDHARLVGGSLAMLDGEKLLLEESVFGKNFRTKDPSYNYVFLPRAETLAGRWTSVISFWYYEYYHWFTDVLTRLAPLPELPDDTRILMRAPLRSFQRESLGMLGVLDRVLETSSEHLLIEEYYFSSPVGMTGCTNPYAVNWLRKSFLPCRSTRDSPKRFFIRRRGKTRGIKNEEEVAQFFSVQGWSTVYPEDLSLSEQIAWFHNAEAIVGEHGAAFTNLLWCRPGCKVLELCADNFLNGCYEGISLCVGIDHQFKVFPAAPDSCFQVPLLEISKYLSREKTEVYI